MPSRISRILVLASVLACTVLPTPANGAGAVLPSGTTAPPASVGARMAVALSPSGTTRWTEVTVPPGSQRAWLVPVRPGAQIDWAPAAWLDALDEASAPRVVRPALSTSCTVKSGPETPPPWTSARAKEASAAFVVQKTSADAKTWANANGYSIGPSEESRVDDLYAAGWQLAAVELPASTFGLSSATLRVSDDGGAVLPLALSGGASATALTVFVIGAGMAGVTSTMDVDRSELEWGPLGSTYVGWRKDLLMGANGALWLRESSSHAALFDDVDVPGGPAIRPVVARYFDDASCVTAAKAVGSSTSAVAPASLTCGARTDLAVALAGTPPANAMVTRLVGVLPTGQVGKNVSIELRWAAARSAVIRAGSYVECGGKPDDPPRAPPYVTPAPSSPFPTTDPPVYTGEGTVYVPGDGCGGGTVTTTETYDDGTYTDDGSSGGCSGDTSDSSEGWDDSDSSDGCSSDSSDGWDSSDSSDDCSSSSSSSSDSDSDGWDSESDDGWDDADDLSFKAKKPVKATKPHAQAPKKKKKTSPVSRFALLAVALLLPLRRRARDLLGDKS